MTLGFPRRVDTSPDARFYSELAKQDLTFEQSVAELVDNAISARAMNVEIHLAQINEKISLLVADDGRGIPLEDIEKKVLRMGGTGTNPGSMNEHGFGLKNSLARLTEGNREFTIMTRDSSAALGEYYIVRGPLSPEMTVDLARKEEVMFWEGSLTHLGLGTGTRVRALTTATFLNSVLARRGRPFKFLDKEHIDALAEHLGVFYRPFLDSTHKIFVKWTGRDGSWNEIEIKGLPVPYEGSAHNERLVIQFEGREYEAYYKWGKLDENLSRSRHKIYYQGNIQTQGIDVKVRKRVVLPHQLTELFGLARHNSMNTLVGELELDDPVFSTVNNKTMMDVNNPLIESLVEEMSTRHLPPHDPRALVFGEAELRKRIAATLRTVTPGGMVQELAVVWSRVGVQVDIIQTIGDSNVIYEVKNRELAPLDVYQLVMYWDALVSDGIRPLVANVVSPEDLPPKLRNLVDFWNSRTDTDGEHYKIEFIRSDSLTAATPSTRSVSRTANSDEQA